MLRIEEGWKSREGATGKNASDVYTAIVWGDPRAIADGGDDADNPVVVEAFVTDHVGGLSQLGNVLNNWDREWLAPGFWKFSFKFDSPSGDRQTNDACFSFTTGGGTTHITNSIMTVQGYGDPNDKDSDGNLIKPANYHGAIGVTDDSVEGVEIHTPNFDFKTTFYISPADMTMQYIASLYRLTGKVNNDPVAIEVDGIALTFEPGELLFMGADGSKRHGYSDWELTCNWSASPNATQLSVGPITGIVKNGWDYLWVRYIPDIDPDSGALIKKPKAVYVERVYTYQALSPIIRPTSFGLGNTQGWRLQSPTSGGGLS